MLYTLLWLRGDINHSFLLQGRWTGRFERPLTLVDHRSAVFTLRRRLLNLNKIPLEGSIGS